MLPAKFPNVASVNQDDFIVLHEIDVCELMYVM